MTFKKKLLFGYGVVFFILSLMLVMSVLNLISLSEASKAILRENYRSIFAADNMLNALERQDSAVLLMFLGKNDEGAAQFRENEALFFQWFGRAKDNITEPGEAELIKKIETSYTDYRDEFFRLIDLEPDSFVSIDKGQRIYYGLFYPNFIKVYHSCLRLRNLNQKAMYATNQRAGGVASRVIWSTIIVGASALIAALIFSFVLSSRIARPLRSLMDASRQIAAGNYDVQIPVEASDEFGQLGREFNQMASHLARFHKMNIKEIISEKQKVDAILTSIEDGLIVLDTKMKVKGINPSARRILNLEMKDVLESDCSEILPEPRIRRLVGNIIKTGKQSDMEEDDRIITLNQGERQFHYLLSVTIIRGRNRSLSGIVLLMKDITRLMEAERLKSDFVMAASHELRTPLTSLSMSIDLLIEHSSKITSEKDRELLQAAHEEVERLKALVSNLLDLSRLETGKIELEIKNISVREILEHIQEVFQSQMAMKSINFSVQSPDDLPKIKADANKLTWVLTNLISNALRYVEKNGTIQIVASNPGRFVQLAVRDDGPGIPYEYQTRIFQKFVQIKEQKPGGTGLGLAICKEIVRAHGGSIWVESRPGEGSNFIFSVPVAE